MSLRNAAAAMLVLAVTTVFAQESAPISAPAARPQSTTRPMPTRRWGKGVNESNHAGPVTQPSLQARMQDLQGTLEKMHAVLKQMQAKAGVNAKDPLLKANREMWELMVGQLDKQLADLKEAEANRADMEVRRAAMYKQAEIKSQAAARAAQATMFSQQPTGAPISQYSGPSTSGLGTVANQAGATAASTTSISPK
ncbi:MAG TPA: hypothetical protein VJQ54_03620 [Candidatus Sulfotelmatobacter sp.]|nr:hypothetical protein [Candidatus Sulfotelmatobacter sp.]